MALTEYVKSVIAHRHRRNEYAPKIVAPGQPKAELELLAALEAERDPPLTDREWAQEESQRGRYSRKGSGR